MRDTAQYRRDRKDWLRMEGICIDCAKSPSTGRSQLCERCGAIHRKATAAKRFRLRSSGICTKCGVSQARYGKWKCPNCAAQDADYALIHSAEQRRVDPGKARQYVRASLLKYKEQAFAHYGTACVTCGESDLSLLTLHHVHGDGREHRRRIGMLPGDNFYLLLRKFGYPDGLQTLCKNCHLKLPRRRWSLERGSRISESPAPA